MSIVRTVWGGFMWSIFGIRRLLTEDDIEAERAAAIECAQRTKDDNQDRLTALLSQERRALEDDDDGDGAGA